MVFNNGAIRHTASFDCGRPIPMILRALRTPKDAEDIKVPDAHYALDVRRWSSTMEQDHASYLGRHGGSDRAPCGRAIFIDSSRITAQRF